MTRLSFKNFDFYSEVEFLVITTSKIITAIAPTTFISHIMTINGYFANVYSPQKSVGTISR